MKVDLPYLKTDADRHGNEPKTGVKSNSRNPRAAPSRFQPLEKLPLFASEEAISAALMGPGKTTEWRQIAPLLERRGFPTIDGLMGGRYIWAIKAFFDREYCIHGASQVSAPHMPAKLGTWKGHRGRRRGSQEG